MGGPPTQPDVAQFLALVDIGSTVLKGALIGGRQNVRSFYHVREANTSLHDQVEGFIAGITTGIAACETRICSSANGGLRIGIACLTRRFSGAAAAHALAAIGANVVYVRELAELAAPDAWPEMAPPVDVLLIVGGVDAFANDRANDALLAVDPTRLPHDRLVFAGHAEVAGRMRQRFPDIERAANPMSNRLTADNHELAERMRLTYLDDIASKKDIVSLAAHSSRPIEPTPAVVSRAFSRLIERLPSPALLLDIGGATTDIHFTKELLDEDRIAGSLANIPAVARYVYTGYGVFASSRSTLQAFTHHPRCIDFLSGLYGDQFREIYLGMLEGDASQRLLFEACILLALGNASAFEADDHRRGPDEPPPLLLNRLATLAITGGGAKVLDDEAICRAFALIAGPEIPVNVLIDRAYCWWTLGMIDDQEITTEVWNAANV